MHDTSFKRMSSIFTTPCPLQTRMVESVNNEILHDDRPYA